MEKLPKVASDMPQGLHKEMKTGERLVTVIFQMKFFDASELRPNKSVKSSGPET